MEKSGISSLNPLQAHVIPLVKKHENIIISAPKNSGKIASFLLPIISMVEKGFDSGRPSARTPTAIITVPSVESGRQVLHEAIKLSHQTRPEFKIVCPVCPES